jgi:hypothetical protein
MNQSNFRAWLASKGVNDPIAQIQSTTKTVFLEFRGGYSRNAHIKVSPFE